MVQLRQKKEGTKKDLTTKQKAFNFKGKTNQKEIKSKRKTYR